MKHFHSFIESRKEAFSVLQATAGHSVRTIIFISWKFPDGLFSPLLLTVWSTARILTVTAG